MAVNDDEELMSGPVEAMARALHASYALGGKGATWESLPLIVSTAWRRDALVAYKALTAYIKENP